MLKNMKLGSKLIGGFLATALLSGVVGLIGIYNISKINTADTVLYEKMTVPIADLQELSVAFQMMRVSMRDMILAKDRATASAKAKKMDELDVTIGEKGEKVAATLLSEGGKKSYADFLEARKVYTGVREKVAALAVGGNSSGAYAAMVEPSAAASAANYQAMVEKLVSQKVDYAKGVADGNGRLASTAMTLMVIVILVALASAIALGIIITRSITTPINETVGVLEKVAAKDMTSRITGDYRAELGRMKDALNTAVENLDKSLMQVSTGAEQVASASEQIGSGSQQLAQGASEQASSLEEISSSLQEMTSMTKQNTANSREAKGLADSAKKGADKGVANMKHLSEAVDKIKKSSDDTAKIVKTIDEIAFQTNLLALNAAVEAARAGDAGKGFAVVAEEVRNLAMRSAEAAKNTANMIEESVKNAESGVEINSDVMKNFDEINTQVAKVSEVMAEIAAASEQQSQGIEQVNTAVQQMNQLTQSSAANSEESASAAQELSSQAQEMQAMVNSFRISGGKVSGAQKPAHRAAAPAHAAAPAAQWKAAKEPAKAPRKELAAVGAGHVDPASAIPLDDVKGGLKEF